MLITLMIILLKENQLSDFPLKYVTQKCHEIQQPLSINYLLIKLLAINYD